MSTRAKATQTPGGADPKPAATAAVPQSKPVVDTSSLPNAVDIDARFLRGPVLTKQGHVCPDEGWQKANPAEFQAHLKAQG